MNIIVCTMSKDVRVRGRHVRGQRLRRAGGGRAVRRAVCERVIVSARGQAAGAARKSRDEIGVG